MKKKGSHLIDINFMCFLSSFAGTFSLNFPHKSYVVSGEFATRVPKSKSSQTMHVKICVDNYKYQTI